MARAVAAWWCRLGAVGSGVEPLLLLIFECHRNMVRIKLFLVPFSSSFSNVLSSLPRSRDPDDLCPLSSVRPSGNPPRKAPPKRKKEILFPFSPLSLEEGQRLSPP